MKNKIIVIFSSHLSSEENEQFKNHVLKTIGIETVEVYCYENFNTASLPTIYNKAIDEHSSDDAIMVFCHNDIEFETKNWGSILLNHFNNKNFDFQIIGVAGATELNEHGCWWLDKTGKNMNFSKMVGIVKHTNGVREWTSKYSEPFFGIKPTLIVDGLFIAVDTTEIIHKFDEKYDGFHFYDLSFCFPNYLDGCNVGVTTDIRILHKSIGQVNEQWETNRSKFSKEYENELPKSVEI